MCEHGQAFEQKVELWVIWDTLWDAGDNTNQNSISDILDLKHDYRRNNLFL